MLWPRTRPPDPVTANCASLTTFCTLQGRDIVCRSRRSCRSSRRRYPEVCSKEVIVNGESCSLVEQMDQKTENDRPVIPLPVRGVIFAMFHDPLYTGPKKTFEVIDDLYFWRKTREEILRWVKHCLKCQSRKISRHNRQALHNYSQNSQRLDTLNIDLVEPLNTSLGFRNILTMRDKLTY